MQIGDKVRVNIALRQPARHRAYDGCEGEIVYVLRGPDYLGSSLYVVEVNGVRDYFSGAEISPLVPNSSVR